MSTTLGILTALILAVSIFLGFKNKEQYLLKIEDRKTEESKRDRNRAQLKDTLEDRDDTKSAKEKREGEAQGKAEDVVKQNNVNDGLTKQIKEKEEQIADQKLKIDQVNEQLKKIGEVGELVPIVRSLRDELLELQNEIGAAEAKLSNLIAEKNRTAAIVSAFEEENDWRNANVSNPKLATRIARIYDSYGFVVLPVGNNAGVVGGSTLEVVRDGSVIAKLLVNTVEASTAAAELIPGSLAADTVLQDGDQVRAVAAKKDPVPTPAAPATPAGEAGEAPADPNAMPAEEDAPAEAEAEAAEDAPAEAAEEGAAEAEEDPFN